MPRRSGLFAGLFLSVVTVLPVVAMAETISQFTLPNGMEAVVIEDHRAPLVVQMVWYRVGSADEPRGHSGIAHFLEHLMFKGTEKIAPGTFSARIEALGGDDNAFTTSDYTAYFQNVAAEHLPLMMEMEADRMRNLRLTEDDVATERQVILEERAQRIETSPGALLNEQMQAAQFLNHPYGIPVIGWRHEMAALSREDALSYYQRFYAPNNAILVVAGDVTPAEVEALAKQYYGPLARSEGLTPRVRAQEPPPIAARRIVLEDPRVSQPYVVRDYLAPERDPGDQRKAAAALMLAELLGGSPTTSVLARKLQFDSQTAVYTSASYSGVTIDDASFSIVVVPLPGVSPQNAEDELDKVLARFLQDGPEPEAFERIKTQVRAATIYAKDDVGGLAQEFGAALATGLSVQDVQDWPDILQSVTKEDVMAVAREILVAPNSVTGWLEQPKEAAE